MARGLATAAFPLTRRGQIEVLEAQIADAKAKGARVLLGGTRFKSGPWKRGHYFQPTVLVSVKPTMKVMREETFGPVIGVMPWATTRRRSHA